MTTLDTFYIDFQPKNAKETASTIDKIDSQLDGLAKKGKKRSDDENKQYEVLKKRRKELLEDTKEQKRETDKLAESFGSIATNIIGAATAFASFGALKTGILDAAKLNSTIYLQSKVTGQSADELRAYGAAIQSFGGDAQSFVNAQKAMAQSAADNGITYKNVGAFLDSIQSQLQEVSSLGEKQRILGLYHIGDLPTQAFLEQANDEYAKNLDLHKKLAQATQDDYLEAFKFEQASADAGTAFSNAFTRIGTDILPLVSEGLGKLNDHIKELEKEQGGLELFFSKIAASAGLLVAPLRAITASFLVASEIGAAEHDILHPDTPRQSYLATKIDEFFYGKPQASAASPKPAASGPYSSMDFLISQGYTPGQAAGILGNAQVESGGNPTPPQNAFNRGHYGKFQWDAKRRAEILTGTGIDVATASNEQQDRAFVWEARSRGDEGRIKSGTTPEGAAAITNSFFERPGGDGSIGARMRAAHQLATDYGTSHAGGTSKSISVKTGDVTINTQATDSNAIARAFKDELNRQLHTAYSSIDDGQDR